MTDMAWFIIAAVVKSIIAIVALLTAFAYMTLIERRVIARFQRRIGPNRAGPLGVLQPLADAHQDGLQRADHTNTRLPWRFPDGASALGLHRALGVRRRAAG